MSLQKVQFQIARTTDKAIIERVDRVGEVVGIKPNGVSGQTFTSDEAADAARVNDYANENTALFKQLQFPFPPSWNVRINRESEDQLVDKVTITPTDANADASAYTKFVAAVKREMRELLLDTGLPAQMTDATRAFNAKQQQAIDRQSDLVDRMFGKMQDMLQQVADDTRAKQAELEEQHRKNTKALEDDYTAKKAKVAEREAALDAEKKKIDDRQSTHVRRELRQKLKDVLKERATTFELTPGTQERRRIVFWFCICLMAAFAIGIIILFSAYAKDETTNWVHIGRQVAMGIGFAATAWFFIRWNNQWFRMHADEEFRLKRMDIDFDRASWLVELTMEWTREKGETIPPELLNRLSANLFTTADEYPVNLHPADSLASTILGSAAKVNLTTPAGSLEFDRKGINRLKDQQD